MHYSISYSNKSLEDFSSGKTEIRNLVKFRRMSGVVSKGACQQLPNERGGCELVSKGVGWLTKVQGD